MSHLEFLVPGVVALAVFNNAVSFLIIRLFYSRLHLQTFESYRLTPISAFSLWWGFVLTGALRSFFTGLVVLFLSWVVVPGLRIPGEIFLWLVPVAVTCGAFGVFLGLCLRSFDDQALISEFLLIPMSFLSGTFVPLDCLPFWLGKLMWLFPLAPIAQLLRQVFCRQPVPVSFLALLLLWLAFFAYLDL
ncbi:ABC-2 type transporter [Ammonifex degensii KC4]|uniref:ABC-2 type transporter n=1 Tax=Ammonifex degensii (strain DSM 10501 / KC4) TaxID=429009 RepID=C9R8V2_AMMDK|nr:ABC transporter permease [Ammonifex degensii]ACX52731.1 ABC-2 type transporter [Ammonifex degensii KC4]